MGRPKRRKRSCTEPAAFEARATRPAFPHGYHGARVRLRRLWREENASLQLLGSPQTEDIFCRSPNPIQPGLLPISWSEHIQIHFVGNHMNFRFSYFGGHLVALHDGRVHMAGEHAARTSDHPLDKWPFAVLGYRPEN